MTIMMIDDLGDGDEEEIKAETIGDEDDGEEED